MKNAAKTRKQEIPKTNFNNTIKISQFDVKKQSKLTKKQFI